MLNRLSFRVLAGLSAAALLPLIAAGTLLMPALRKASGDLRLSSTRSIAETVEPAFGQMLDGLIAAMGAAREDPVVANRAADDAARLKVLRHFATTSPGISGITLHRATDIALTTREERTKHPDGATWERLGSGRMEAVVRTVDGGATEISLIAATSTNPAGAVAEVLEFHLSLEALAAPVSRIRSTEVALVDDRGQVLAHRNSAWIGRRFHDPLSVDSVLAVPVRLNGEPLAAPWQVMVRVPQAEVAGLQAKAAGILVMVALLGLGFALLAGWRTVRWVEAPLIRAGDAVARLEQRDFNVRLKDGGPAGMAALNRGLNSLAQKLDSFIGDSQMQRDRLASRLREEEERFRVSATQVRAVGAGSRDGFLLLAGDGGTVSWWNPRFAQFGRFAENDLALLDAKQIIQRVAWQFADSERFLEWWHKAASRAEEGMSQLWALRQPEDGAARVSVFPARDAKGAAFGFLWRFEDRTEEARLQRQAQDVERAELIGNLTTGIGHEFNRILTGVVGDIAALDQNVDAAARESAVAHAKEAANQAAAICRGLLGYSRLHLLETRVNGVGALLAWLKDQLSDGLGPEHSVQIELPEKNLHVTADRNRIRSVLLELCGNAIRAMPHGGTLRVAAEPLQLGADEHQPGDLEAGHFICFTVEDTGGGIPEEIRTRIFQPFFTTDSRSSGLGLAAVSGIVWQHGGWITCDSEVGKGTCIRVYLPASELPVTVVVEDGRQPIEARQIDDVARSENGYAAMQEDPFILVIDDEDNVRRLNQAILKRGGFASMGARGGEEGLALCRQYRDRIALVVLDLNMPGMSGAEVFRILRAEGAYVPVIVVSGYLLDFNAFAMDYGARPAGFVQKPYQADELLLQVRGAMAREAA